MNDQNESKTSRAAVVTDGVVTNVIVVAPPQADEDEFALEGSDIILLADDTTVGLGWLWDGVEFNAPEE